MLRCLSGGCSSQVQHWPARLYASRGLSVPALLPDTLYSPKSAEQREDRSLFPQSVFNLPVPALFSSTAGVISYPVISGLTKELCSPPISPLPWSKDVWAFPLCPPTSTFLEGLLKFRSSTFPKSTSFMRPRF